MKLFPLLRRTVQLVGRENYPRLLLLLPLALVMSGVEVVAAAVVYAMLSLATGAAPTFELPVLGDIRDFTTLEGTELTIAVVAATGVFFVAKSAMKVGHTYVQTRIVQNMAARLSSRMMAGYLSMPYAYHLRRNSSELIRNTNQVVKEVFGDAIKPMIKTIAETMLVIGMLGFLISVSPVATLIAFVVLGTTSIILLKILRPRLSKLGTRNHRLRATTLQTLQQAYEGVRDIKVLGGERPFAQRYLRDQKALAKVAIKRHVLKDLPSQLVELSLLGFILLYFAAMVLLGQDTPETLAILGLFAYVGQRLQKSTEGILAAINQLQYASTPIDQLESDARRFELEAESMDNPERLPFEDRIRVEDVTFRYEAAHRNALDGIDLEIRKGEVIGICGPTGGGKTTLVDVITGLLKPTDGRVTVDAMDLSDHARAWQRNLGVVPQMVFLVDGTLRENIALAEAPRSIDEDAVQEAVDLAQLRGFVDSLPEGLDTFVGERGVRVSGGQRQRVAIARALYRHPTVLVFDEGTSALDNTTEREVMSALHRLRGQHTILLIAHRLTTVEDADQIVLIKDGRVTATGRYQELLESSRDFAALAST